MAEKTSLTLALGKNYTPLFKGRNNQLNKQTPKSQSLRTTIPFSIIKQFGLTEYDKLEWILKAEGGELIIQVKPKRGKIC